MIDLFTQDLGRVVTHQLDQRGRAGKRGEARQPVC